MIRHASETDTLAVRALFELCFPDGSGFNRYFFEHEYRPENTLLYEQDGEICAMLQMLPYQMDLEGQQGSATYIYGACTHPAHRRKHLMARLLEASFAEDRQAGRLASFLIPQEDWLFEFYRPFGYLPAFSLEKRTVLRGEAPKVVAELLMDWKEADKLYRQGTAREPCRILRSAGDWQAQLSLFGTLGAGTFGLYENGGLMAYAFVWREENGLFAQELFAVDDVYAQTLCQALLHRLDAPEIVYCTAGSGQMLGCIKPYQAAPERGYMNLMFN